MLWVNQLRIFRSHMLIVGVRLKVSHVIRGSWLREKVHFIKSATTTKSQARKENFREWRLTHFPWTVLQSLPIPTTPGCVFLCFVHCGPVVTMPCQKTAHTAAHKSAKLMWNMNAENNPKHGNKTSRMPPNKNQEQRTARGTPILRSIQHSGTLTLRGNQFNMHSNSWTLFPLKQLTSQKNRQTSTMQNSFIEVGHLNQNFHSFVKSVRRPNMVQNTGNKTS